MSNDYFNKVVKATEKYLGPASERFIKRQIEFHLNKQPEDIDASDIDRIKDSVGVALGLLVDDKSMVNQAIKDITNSID